MILLRKLDHSASRGFTVVEICVALTLCTIAVLGLSAAMKAGSDLQVRTEEYSQANRAISTVHERMNSGDVDLQYDAFRANPVYPYGQVTVEVSFPEELLLEVIGGPVPGTWRYRDLDGDGEVERDASSPSLTSLVPVSVLATWSKGEMRSRFVVTEK